ncbi:MAG: MATE family efflux transporter, partial [Rhizobiaceae bacterium]
MSKPAVFVTGSIFRHVAVTAATGSIGLIAVFVVDVLNLFYISRLGVSELAAAVGFAGTLMFFTTSLAIGLTIPASAMVARALGAGNRIAAAQIGGVALGYSLGASSILAIALFPFIEDLLSLLGAKGETLQLATGFMQIVMPSSPVLAVGMAAAGILRGAGDARRAMHVTLA